MMDDPVLRMETALLRCSEDVLTELNPAEEVAA